MAASRPRRGNFTSLLSVPTPLPDDDQPEPQAPPEPPAAAERAAPQPARSPRAHPPSTIRLAAQAGQQLWQAYLEAKHANPFLSYRQFASGVVLDGLAAHRRRQQRSSS